MLRRFLQPVERLVEEQLDVGVLDVVLVEVPQVVDVASSSRNSPAVFTSARNASSCAVLVHVGESLVRLASRCSTTCSAPSTSAPISSARRLASSSPSGSA